MKRLLILLAITLPSLLPAQEKIMLNGGFIIIRDGAYLVTANNSPGAIVKTGPDGGISINDALSRLRWLIGTTTGSYTVPFVMGNTALPVSFATAGGSGPGYFDFATFQTPTWKNSDFLPP